MLKWFTSLVLVAALSGSVTAGVQMHGDMNVEMMDCCKAALANSDSPATSEARLCCALNCQEPVPTGSSTIQPLSSFAAVPAAAVPRTVVQDVDPRLRPSPTIQHSRTFQPSYILHLALLI
jgi:hypothetical protein